MPKNIKILEGFNESIEEFGFALGEAEDFLDRVEPMFYDLISALVQGRVSPADARRKVWEEFTNGRADIVRWRMKRGADAYDYGYTHLDPDLIPTIPTTNSRAPFIRIMTQLPKDIA